MFPRCCTIVTVALLALALAPTGCRKQDPPEKAADKAAVAEGAKPAAGKAGPAAGPAAIDEPAGAAVEKGKAGETPSAREEPRQLTPAPDPPELLPPPPSAPPETKEKGPGAGAPSADSVAVPAIDMDRLKTVFVELWCAERRGATPDELLALYHKHDYPPLENWYGVWNEAVLAAGWSRIALSEAKARCPDVAGPLEAPKDGPTPVMAPAPDPTAPPASAPPPAPDPASAPPPP